MRYYIITAVFILLPLADVQGNSEDHYTVFYRNDNIALTPHPEPDSFTVNSKGEMMGVTSSGIAFSQTNIISDITSIQKFKIQEAWWYISDRGIIGLGEGLTEIEALSIYLTLPELTA